MFQSWLEFPAIACAVALFMAMRNQWRDGHILERVHTAARQLKVFPLPSVGLLPGTIQPLHIFEQPYRDMMKDVFKGDGIFALAQMLPGKENNLSSRPGLESMLCVGVTSMHEFLEDGRYNVMLVGVVRARLVREFLRMASYREVEAEVLEDPTVDGEEELALRQAVLELIARVPETMGEKIAQFTGRLHGGQLADVVAAIILHDPAQRFKVLLQTDVRVRMHEVTTETIQLITRLHLRKSEGFLN